MQRRGDEPRVLTSEPALRVIMRRLREIMSEPGDGQARLDKIVKQIAGVMVSEVCSIYLKRQDGSLELFATEGLKQEAVHKTDITVFPLAFPLLAGPGALTSIVLLIGKANDYARAGLDHPQGYVLGMWIFSTLGFIGLAFAILLRIRETGPQGHRLETITTKTGV